MNHPKEVSWLNKPGILRTDWIHRQDSETHEQRSVTVTRGGLWKGLGRQVGRLGVLTKRREMTVQKSNSSQSNDSLEKTPIDGKDRRQEEKEVTEDEMVGWHHRLDGPEFEWTQPGVLKSTGSQRGGHDWVTEQQSYESPQQHCCRKPMWS